jgi:ArsR family transcriptional regulator, virulence genes transcriptional regulator
MNAQHEKKSHTAASSIAKPDIKTSYHNLKKAALVLRALNHKLRQEILKLIDQEKKITVTEIYVRMRLEQSVTSQHLAIMREAGIVVTQREGKFIYYLINHKRINQIFEVAESLLNKNPA